MLRQRREKHPREFQDGYRVAAGQSQEVKEHLPGPGGAGSERIRDPGEGQPGPGEHEVV